VSKTPIHPSAGRRWHCGQSWPVRGCACDRRVEAPGWQGAIEEESMGDRSPKSKQRDQKQKDAVKAKDKSKKDAVVEAGRVVIAKKK
jgi:hypothetical protein